MDFTLFFWSVTNAFAKNFWQTAIHPSFLVRNAGSQKSSGPTHHDFSCCCFSPWAEEREQDKTAVSNVRESDECPENQATTIALQGQEGWWRDVIVTFVLFF